MEENEASRNGRNWRFWAPKTSSTVDVRQGDRNTDNFNVLTASMAILVAVGVGFVLYYWMVPEIGLMKPAG